MKSIVAIFFLLGLLLAHLFGFGQSKSDKIYEAFADEEGVSSFSISKDMLNAFDIEINDEENVIGDVSEIRFMSYNPAKGNFSGANFLDKAISMLPARYKQYKNEDNEASNSEIWLLGKQKKYSECHVFVAGDSAEGSCFVISFYGDFRVDDVQKLKETGREMAH